MGDRKKRDASDGLAEKLHLHHRVKRAFSDRHLNNMIRKKKRAARVLKMAQDGMPETPEESFEEEEEDKLVAAGEDRKALKEWRKSHAQPSEDEEDIPLLGTKLPKEEDGDPVDDMAYIATLLSKAKRIGEVTHLLRKYGKDLKKEAEEEAIRQKNKKAEEEG